jgi:hypothetical protein
MYFIKENNKYVPVNFYGFPLEGYFIVTKYSRYHIEPTSLKEFAFLIHKNTICQLLMKKESYEDLYEYLKNPIIPLDEKFEQKESKDIYTKNSRYKRIGKEFFFPTSGIYYVIDGKENQYKKFASFEDFKNISIEVPLDIIEDIVNIDCSLCLNDKVKIICKKFAESI